jgi:hypothetical protein
MSGTSRRAITVSAAVVALIGGGAAVASIPDSKGVITMCVRGASERVIDTAKTHCAPGRKTVKWNAKGPKGPKGDKGVKGDPGTSGAPAALPVVTEHPDGWVVGPGRYEVLGFATVEMETAQKNMICQVGFGAGVTQIESTSTEFGLQANLATQVTVSAAITVGAGKTSDLRLECVDAVGLFVPVTRARFVVFPGQ